MRETTDQSDAKVKKRPELAIYRPGMGLRNRVPNNNNENREKVKPGESSTPAQDGNRRSRKPDRKVYVPKPVREHSKALTSLLPDGHSEIKRQPMMHVNREPAYDGPKSELSSLNQDLGNLAIGASAAPGHIQPAAGNAQVLNGQQDSAPHARTSKPTSEKQKIKNAHNKDERVNGAEINLREKSPIHQFDSSYEIKDWGEEVEKSEMLESISQSQAESSRSRRPRHKSKRKTPPKDKPKCEDKIAFDSSRNNKSSFKENRRREQSSRVEQEQSNCWTESRRTKPARLSANFDQDPQQNLARAEQQPSEPKRPSTANNTVRPDPGKPLGRGRHLADEGPKTKKPAPGHGGLLKLPYEVQLEEPPRCIVQKQLFNPNNPNKPLIVYESHRAAYPQQTPFPPQSPFPEDPYFPEEPKSPRVKPQTNKLLQEMAQFHAEIDILLNSKFSTIDFEALERYRYQSLIRYRQVALTEPRFCAESGLDQELWRVVFHQPIEMCRKVEPPHRSQAQKVLIRIVDQGVKYFEELLVQQEEKFDFCLSKLLENPYEQCIQKPLLRILAVTLQRALLFLGDLARYLELATDSSNFGKARSYYLNAQKIAPKNGRPYYQLALLALYTKRKLDVVYYYMRSLAASNPFLSARESLLSLFEETRKKFEAMEQLWTEQKLDRDKLKAQERLEEWVHPSGRPTPRSPSQHCPGPAALEPDLPTPELQKRFVTCFLHVHGKLFTKIGMENFPETVNYMLKLFRHLLRRSPLPLDEAKLVQLMAINMFSVANTALKVEEGCSYLQEQALAVSLDMASLLLERAVVEGATLLVPLRVWGDWLSCQPQLWQPPPGPSPFRPGCRDSVWGLLAALLNVLQSTDLTSLSSRPAPGLEAVSLPEDRTLAGFVPLLGAPQVPAYCQPPVTDEMRHLVRVSCILFFGDYLCGIDEPYLKFDVQSQQYLSIVPQESKMLSLPTTVEEAEDVSSESSSSYSSDSDTLEEDEADPIQKLWLHKERLRKTCSRQARHHAKVQAALQQEEAPRATVTVRPKHLVADTNCFIDHLELMLSFRDFKLVVPLVVVTELDGLARAAGKLGERARQALAALEARFAARDHRVAAVTAKGTILDSISFRTEETAKGTNDDVVLECCLHLCSQDSPHREVVLLTEDRNLRIKAMAQRVPVRPPRAFARWVAASR